MILEHDVTIALSVCSMQTVEPSLVVQKCRVSLRYQAELQHLQRVSKGPSNGHGSQKEQFAVPTFCSPSKTTFV